MPTYTIRDPQSGRTVSLTGDSPPTEQELTDIFSKLSLTSPLDTTKPTSTGLMASLRERAFAKVGASPDADLATVLKANARHEDQRILEGARAMPGVGGAIGGLMGGIPGAAAGGVVGEAVHQVIDRTQRPSTMSQQGVAMGKAGLTQGALQAGGGRLAWGGGQLARWLMNRATTRVTQKLALEFPGLSDTLIDHALTVSKGGYEKAHALLKAAKAPATAALKTADTAGAAIPVVLTPELAETLTTALIQDAVKSGQVPKVAANTPIQVATKRLSGPLKTMIADIDAAKDGGTITLNATQSDVFKTQLQKESRRFYFNKIAPNGPNALPAEATLKAEYATRLNEAIDLLAKGYKAANTEAQPLIGAVRGLKQAIRPSGNLLQAMVRPGMGALVGGAAGSREGHPYLGAVAGAALTSPRGMSMEAIGLGNPVVQQFLKQLPRAAYAALMAALPASADTPPGDLARGPR